MFLQSKKKVIATSDQISRKLKENDPREKFVKCEALPGGIFQKVKTDPKDLSLTLLKHTPFWMDWQNYKPVRAEGISEIRPIGNELYILCIVPFSLTEFTYYLFPAIRLLYQS